MIKALSSLSLGAIILCSCSCSLTGRGSLSDGPVSYTTILAGAHSAAESYSVKLIKNENEWEQAWLETAGNIDPLPARPSINFDREFVIAAFMGERPSSGFKIEITKIIKKSNKLNVHITRFETPGMLPVVTHPFCLVRLPRGDYQLELIEEMAR